MSPIKKTFEINISGEWFDEEMKMFEKGFEIKSVNTWELNIIIT